MGVLVEWMARGTTGKAEFGDGCQEAITDGDHGDRLKSRLELLSACGTPVSLATWLRYWARRR